MNETTFSRAEGLYKAGDYRGALRKFTDCLRDNDKPMKAGEFGEVYYKIGNCLMKMKNPNEALKAYKKAAEDPQYTKTADLHTNTGKAYSSLRDYDHAMDEFQAALDDPTCTARHKALMGMGNIQLKMGDSLSAGRSFREAALDSNNEDPSKALLNLGICFMSMGRAEDAIASYESARDFNMSTSTRNRLLSSEGQAYAALNQPEKAVECFKEVLADGKYTLSDSASVDYTRCVNELARKANAGNSGENDFSGLDVSTSDDLGTSPDDYFYDDGTAVLDKMPGYIDAYEGDDDKFFTATEDELKDIYKAQAKKERKRRGVGLKILIFFIILLVLAAGAAVAAYYFGYGYPTQETIAQEVFANPDDLTSDYSPQLTDSSKKQMTSVLVQDDAIDILGVERSMSDSKVYVSATTQEGGELTYCLTMARDMISWKVTNIELYFASQNS